MKAQLATNDGICEVLFNCVEKMRELLSLYDQGHAVLQRPGLESVLESAVAQLELQSSKIDWLTSSRKQPAARRASDKEREGGQSDVSSCSLCSDGAMSAEGTFVWKKIRRNEKYYHPKADKRSAENPWITSQFRHKATSKNKFGSHETVMAFADFSYIHRRWLLSSILQLFFLLSSSLIMYSSSSI